MALLVCLIPTTIGGLLSAIGISGIDRLIRRNVMAVSGRAVEAAGDVDVLLTSEEYYAMAAGLAQLRELDRLGLGHNTFTGPAVDLIVRSADGVLRKARNLGVGCLIEAVRSANKTIDIDNVNRVLLQPHWQKEVDLTDF